MPFAARHRNDPSPAMDPLPGLVVRRETDAAAMAALQGRAEDEMARRFDAGHRAYVARARRRARRVGLGRHARGRDRRAGLDASPSRPASGTSGTSSRSRRTAGWGSTRACSTRSCAPSRARRSGSGSRTRRRTTRRAPASGRPGSSALAELSFDAAGRAALKALVPGGGARRVARARAARGARGARAVLALRARGPRQHVVRAGRSAAATTSVRCPAARRDDAARGALRHDRHRRRAGRTRRRPPPRARATSTS